MGAPVTHALARLSPELFLPPATAKGVFLFPSKKERIHKEIVISDIEANTPLEKRTMASMCRLVGVLLLCFCGSRGENMRPIIGVLAQKNSDWPGKGDTFIRSSYFSYAQQAGARAVPIRVEEDDEYYEKMFKSINGLLLPGGGVSVLESGYAAAAGKLFQMALEANDKGDHFPIWGTCLGYEQLAVLVAGEDVLSSVAGWNLTLPLTFTTDYRKSRMYGGLSSEIYGYVTREEATQNMHHYGLLTKTYMSNEKLKNFFTMLTTNTDENGLEYVSSMEAKHYPFYAVQYHPEKNIYEWDLKVAVDHSEAAVEFAQDLADVFVQEARASDHRFDTTKEESQALINNYQSTYIGEPSFMTLYFFNYNHTERSESSPSQDGDARSNVFVYNPEVRIVQNSYQQQIMLMLLLLGATVVLVAVLRACRLATLKSRLRNYRVAEQAEEYRDMKLYRSYGNDAYENTQEKE